MKRPSIKNTIYGDEHVDGNYTSISFRLHLLIIMHIKEDKKIYSILESNTKIHAATWRQWHRRYMTSEPSARLIQAAGLCWPEFAFWLITGFSDPFFGHKKPILGKTIRHSFMLNQMHDEAFEKKSDELAIANSFYFKTNLDHLRKIYGTTTDEEDGLNSVINFEVVEQKKLDMLLLARAKKAKELIDKLIKQMEC